MCCWETQKYQVRDKLGHQIKGRFIPLSLSLQAAYGEERPTVIWLAAPGLSWAEFSHVVDKMGKRRPKAEYLKETTGVF